MNRRLGIGFILLLIASALSAQTDWKLNTRQSFYTGENHSEALLVVPESYLGKSVHLTMSVDGKLCIQKDTLVNEALIRLPFPIAESAGPHSKVVVWLAAPALNRELLAPLPVLPPKPNMVKIDRLTGGLLVDDLPFFPFGFYCYSPVHPTLAEEEGVNGFNLLSAYQKIEKKSLAHRQTYMDRCAQLGMKVHYNLLSVAGGGGVGSGRDASLDSEQKQQLLIEEILRFKDHPALLAWYISDEPTGHGADPDSLAATYELIHTIDPYHPVSIVFMAPMQARKYADAMDIVMADPYPVPNSPIRSVGTVTKNLKKEFFAEKPVWIVPQAFGGAEHWSREPSLRELRAMTWLAVVEGATGIQYFIRQGLNGFPKSVATWGECGKMALEIQELLPWLLKGNKLTGFTTSSEGVRVAAWGYQGELLIVAVNEANEPKSVRIESPFSLEGSDAEVLFESRNIPVNGTTIADLIDGYGTRVYRLTGASGSSRINPGNLILDPGFEDISSPGVPASCYAAPGSDRGATYFLDTRMPLEGRHALRLMTPVEGKGVALTFFPVRLSSGTGYTLSVWARMEPNSMLPLKRTFWQKLFGIEPEKVPEFRFSAGSYGTELFGLDTAWTQYKIHFQVPAAGTMPVNVNPRLELISQGTARFDLLELYPDPVISFGINTANSSFEIHAETSEPEGLLRYTLDGTVPDFESPVFIEPLFIQQSTLFTVGLFVHARLVNTSSRLFSLHQGIGKKPVYQAPYSAKYHAGGEYGLVDGVRGSRDYLDGAWQGFMRKDLDVVIDLGQIQAIRKLEVGCLQDHRSWIFMPTEVEFWASKNGADFFPLGSVVNTIEPNANGAIRQDFKFEISDGAYRFIRVQAHNLGICPEWHNGKGQAAYLFVDEIVIE